MSFNLPTLLLAIVFGSVVFFAVKNLGQRVGFPDALLVPLGIILGVVISTWMIVLLGRLLFMVRRKRTETTLNDHQPPSSR